MAINKATLIKTKICNYIKKGSQLREPLSNNLNL